MIFDSNIRLSRDNPESVFGSITSIGGRATYSGPRFDATIAADGSISRYTGDSSLNSEQFGVAIQSFYRTPRSIYALGLRAQRASTLTTELADAGNLSRAANQLSFSAEPTWQYEWSPRDFITVSGSASYRTADSEDFADQAAFSFSTSWQHRLSGTSSLSLTARASYLESTGSLERSRVQSYGILAGWSASFSDRLSFSISAGPRLAVNRSSTGTPNADSETTIGADVDVVLSYRLAQLTSISLNAGQTLEPSSSGEIQERQRVAFSLDHQLSSKASFAFSGTVQRNGAGLAGRRTSGEEQRLFFGTTANVSYQITQRLSASAQHFFRAQQLSDSGGGMAFSHGFAIVLSYSPRAWMFRH